MYIISVFLPLLSFFLSFFLFKILSNRHIDLMSCSLIGISTFFSILGFYSINEIEPDKNIILADWLSSGSLYIDWSLNINRLSIIMILLVNFISLLVHVYSVGYMHNDEKKPIFMSYLSLFTFFMLVLVSSSNLIQLFLGWEGVGLTSYLLIGYYNHKSSANEAAIKAFVVNRVGDFGFLIGIFAIFIVFGTVNLKEIFLLVDTQENTYFDLIGFSFHALTLITMLLFVGSMGKSAQFGLHTWLADAMEGPTPVSALIHAATMVTAGVFLMVLMSPLLEKSEFTRNFILIVGCLTCFFAASVAITQDDIKKIIAYSTCSQLGYMFIAIGISAYNVAIFHLVTHAFFKALLFLGAGSVIHAMSDEQNIKKMGGLFKKIPVTYLLMLVGTLSLTGFPFFSAYYSKDLILEILYTSSNSISLYIYIIAVIVVLLTSFYSFRLFFYVFHGKCNADEKVIAHVHESPNVMLIPLVVLSFFSIFSGILFKEYFFGISSINFWNDSLVNISLNITQSLLNQIPLGVKKLPFMNLLLGLILSSILCIFYKNLSNFLKLKFSLLHVFLKKKWYFDEIYELLFVKTSNYLGDGFWKSIDVELIDNIGPNGVSRFVRKIGLIFSSFQTGYLYHYALSVIIGLTIFISIYFYIF